MRSKPIILLPFIVIAFLESLALELIYFSTRFPISLAANPIINKFLGEPFTHYPGNLMFLPKFFYYAQVLIYVFFGVLLGAATINIVKNLKENLPIRIKAIIKNALRNYLSFLLFGIFVIIVIFFLKESTIFLYGKGLRFLSRHFNLIPPAFSIASLTISLFLTNIFMQALLISTIPIMVIEKRTLLKSLWMSIALGIRNFLTILSLITLPFLIYLPFNMLKTFSSQLIDKTVPEINLYVTALSIVVAIFVDSFTTVCVAQFILDRKSLVK